MTERLFREEALEHHARGSRPGDPLRLDDAATNRWFTAVVALVVAAAVLAAVIRVPVYDHEGVVRERVAVALVPTLRHVTGNR